MSKFNKNYFGAPALERKYNDNHGPDGKFTSADGGGSSIKPTDPKLAAVQSRMNAKLASEAADKAGTHEAHAYARRAAFDAMAAHEEANGGKQSSYMRALYEHHKQEAARLRKPSV
jgi:hypothetical protein